MVKKFREYDEDLEDTEPEDIEETKTKGNDTVVFITNNEEIKEQKFSWNTLLMYLIIVAGAVLFIITASLDPRESNNLYITAGVLIGVAFLFMLYINRN